MMRKMGVPWCDAPPTLPRFRTLHRISGWIGGHPNRQAGRRQPPEFPRFAATDKESRANAPFCG
jgi:hypothetical protein